MEKPGWTEPLVPKKIKERNILCQVETVIQFCMLDAHYHDHLKHFKSTINYDRIMLITKRFTQTNNNYISMPK